MRRVILAMAALVVLCGPLSACSSPEDDVNSTPSPSASPSPSAASELGPLGAPGCDPPSPLLGNETEGTPTGGITSAFGLFQGADPESLRADSSPIKLVVRLDGEGDLRASLRSHSGGERALDWGPEAHVSSNYVRPGDEWGTGFSFESPGCWELLLERDNGSASFWLEVDS